MAREKSGDVALLGLVAAARRLDLCVATVRGFADSGDLPSTRDSAGRRLFFAWDVAALAKQRRKAAKRRART